VQTIKDASDKTRGVVARAVLAPNTVVAPLLEDKKSVTRDEIKALEKMYPETMAQIKALLAAKNIKTKPSSVSIRLGVHVPKLRKAMPQFQNMYAALSQGQKGNSQGTIKSGQQSMTRMQQIGVK
jgi:hypothetical protein